MRALACAAAPVVAAFVVMGLAAPVAAQTSVFGLTVEGDVEAGGRIYIDEPSAKHSAKFEEYRDLPQLPYLERFHLRLFRPDERYSFEFEGSKWGQEDQEFSLRTGRLGRWEFGFEWNQIQHIFSTNARMLATETSRGVFALPGDLAGRAANAGFPTDGARYNAARTLDEIGVRWDTARISFKLTPTPDLELKAEYTRINKDGDRPMGMAFGFTLIEVLEPIEQTIHDFRLQGTIARERWQLQFGYTFSVFDNSLTSITVDNPVRITDAALAFSAGTGKWGSVPASGVSSLPPDNTAHTFNLAGGVNLPWWRTRVTSNVAYSLWLQNDDFLPHTRNPVLIAATSAQGGSTNLVLPQKSLNGNVQTLLFNVNATSRPLPPLTLSLKYRLYEYMDLSDVITFPGHVETDATLEGESIRASRWSFRKQNTEIDGRWRIARPVAFTLGAGWERWDRNEVREVPESDELFGKAVLDLTPSDWLLVSAKYIPSFRRINRYNTRAPLLGQFPEHEAMEQTAAQSVLLRKFDEADRDRQRADLLFQLTPTDTLTATPTVSYRWDDYIGVVLGLKREISWSAGMDVNWTPAERVSFSAGYMHESIFRKQRGRYRPASTLVHQASDFEDFDWINVNTDTVETVHGGIKATLIPKVLDWTLTGNFSYALGTVQTRNPVAPGIHTGVGITAPGVTAQTAATAKKHLPDFEDRLLRLETALKYHFWKSWTAKLGYIFESFDKDDWRTERLDPFIPGISATSPAIFLGNDLKDYTAHIVALTLGYRFK